MKIPNLQLALDHSNISNAIASAVSVREYVDIFEAGTVLLLATGNEVLQCLRKLFHGSIIIADTKCADAGGTVAQNCAASGADWMTVICCASIATMKAAAKAIKQVQVELYGDWTFDQARQWMEAGIEQVIYHQSRDALLAGETWGRKDLDKIDKLIDMGFKVSVTGGLTKETLELFRGLDVYTFIVGRGITEADDPVQTAKEIKSKIIKIWGARSDIRNGAGDEW